MQAWKHKLDTADAFYVTVKGGFSFSRNGATFTEVEKKDNKSRYILAELQDGKGGTSYDLMSLKSWEIIKHNADAIIGMCKAFSEGAKARTAAQAEEAKKQAVTLKGAGLSPMEITALLKSRGYSEAQFEDVLK